uniref:Uncharacterized protein n=1 Tax=Aegilops tauschii TaxID=37682 RepID=M8BGI9_AEGTA
MGMRPWGGGQGPDDALPTSPRVGAGGGWGLRLEAAVQTIHPCESTASSATPRAAQRAPASRRSSRSVRALPVSAPPPGAVILGTSTDWKEDEEDVVDGLQRKVKRYRMIEELYAATEKVVPASSGGRKKKQNKK